MKQLLLQENMAEIDSELETMRKKAEKKEGMNS